MACPRCGCKVTYYYDIGDGLCNSSSGLERCSACGEIFNEYDAMDDDDDEYVYYGMYDL